MQPRVKITYDEGTEAIAPIQSQGTSFGASFDCDVVVLADDVADRLFSVRQDKLRTLLTAQSETEISLQRQGAIVSICTSDEIEVFDGDSVILGSATLEFMDVGRPRAGYWLTPLRRFDSLPTRAIIMAAGSLVLCGTAYATFLANASGTELEDRMARSNGALAEEAPAAIAAASALPFASGAPIVPKMSDTPPSDVYVDDDTKKLQFMLKNGSDDIRVFADENIRRAVEVALSMSGAESGKVLVKNGVAVISSAPKNGDWRDTFKAAMLSDVPGLKDVEFSGADGSWEKEVQKRVLGVWAGKNPYLILTENTTVHANQELMEGVRFMKVISPEVLVLSIYGEEKEFHLK